MNTNRFKDTFGRSPLHTKVILIASALLAIATFLPWYQDVDTYRTGDQFLGVTGPTSFLGMSILVLAAASFLMTAYRMLGKRLIKLPWKESSFLLFAAAQSFFLLLVTNSIFFHPKFGINITLKESLFGMSFALLTSIGFCVGAYLMKAAEATSGEGNELGQLNPLINFGNRTHTPVTPPQTQPTPSHTPVTDEEPSLL